MVTTNEFLTGHRIFHTTRNTKSGIKRNLFWKAGLLQMSIYLRISSVNQCR